MSGGKPEPDALVVDVDSGWFELELELEEEVDRAAGLGWVMPAVLGGEADVVDDGLGPWVEAALLIS